MEIRTSFLNNKLGKTFVTSHRAIDDNVQLLFTVKWKEFTGYGTALLPYPAEERRQWMMDFDRRWPLYQETLRHAGPFEVEHWVRYFRSTVPRCELEAIDLALHDLLGKVLNQSLCSVWGLEKLALPLSGFSLSAGETFEEYFNQLTPEVLAYPILKVKMKHSSPLGVLEKIRDHYQGQLWVDANGGWSRVQTLGAMETLLKAGVTLLEQPLPAGRLNELAGLKSISKIQLIADEDCTTLETLFDLKPFYDGVAIKLHKAGGLIEVRNMIGACQALGLSVMLGCRTESAIGISAISQLGGLVEYLDLDGAMDIVDDPFSGIRFDQGRIIRSGAPGLGVITHD